MKLPYGFFSIRLLPKTVVVPLVFMYCAGLQGAAKLKEAFADHYFFEPETWWAPLVCLVLYNACLLLYLLPVLKLTACECEADETKQRLARLALHRFRGLPWFTVALSIALLLSLDAITAVRLGVEQSDGMATALKTLMNLGAGFFLGVLVQFLLENSLFETKKAVRRYAPDLELPYQSLYFKIFLVMAAVTVHLVIQTIAVLPSFIVLERPADPQTAAFLPPPMHKGGLALMRKNAEILFNAAHYGAKDALEVFLLQMLVYLGFVGLMVLQIKKLIKMPLKTIGGRLRDLNQGRPEDLCSIDVVQNDEFAEVFGEINKLIDTQKSALTASEQRLAHVVSGAADPIVVFDGSGRVRLFNPAAEAFFGYSAEEALKLRFPDLVELPPELARECRASSAPLVDFLGRGSPTLSRQQGLRKDGTRRPFESSISVAETPEGPLATAILRDIAARLAEEEALTKAKTAAENANRMKSEFLANMSHELRTPLNAVLGFTQLLSNDKNLTGGQLEKIGIISRSGEHLLALINDILDISKIEAGKSELHSAVFDLDAFVRDLRDLFLLKCQKKGLSLDVEVLEGMPRWVRGDLGKLRQVMINLIGNAVKFTAEGGIGIVVGPDGDRVRFSVNDSGKGIPAAELDLIMQPFMQSSTNDNEGGTGLGLSISQRFIDLMGGRLEVESRVGEGSSFSFALPLESSPEAPEDEAPEPRAVAVKAGTSALALIVDDKATNRLILKEMLEGVGFSTLEAENGKEAVERTKAYRPRVVFMDIKMPVMDGYAAAEAIKADPELADIPVFALTASAFKHDEERIRKAGFDGYLAKPYKQSSLFRLIRTGTDIGMEYEKPAEAAEEAAPSAEAPGTVRARLGEAGLAALDDMALINDFTALRAYAETLRADLPGFAALLVRHAGAFDEAALAGLLASVRGAKEKE